MDPIAGPRLSPTDTLLMSYFFIFLAKKYKATAQMYRLKRCTNYIKNKNKNNPQTTELIVKNKPAFVTEVNSFYLISLLKLWDIGKNKSA